MAFKDWKKEGERYWESKEKFGSGISKDAVQIVQLRDGKWETEVKVGLTGQKSKTFNSKPQALRFAKQYMRTH